MPDKDILKMHLVEEGERKGEVRITANLFALEPHEWSRVVGDLFLFVFAARVMNGMSSMEARLVTEDQMTLRVNERLENTRKDGTVKGMSIFKGD